MIRYNEFSVLLRGKNFKRFKIKDIKFASIARVLVGFVPKIYGFFGFDLFWVRVKKIVFRTQNFRGASDQIFRSGQFLTGLVLP